MNVFFERLCFIFIRKCYMCNKFGRYIIFRRQNLTRSMSFHLVFQVISTSCINTPIFAF